jgi:hypothetical protein
MERITIYLTPDRMRRLRQVAAEDGVSMAEIVRQALDAKLGQRPKPLSLGIGASGYTDTGRLAGEMKFVPRSWR